MTYRVYLQRTALHDLGEAYRWMAVRAPSSAANWLDRFEQALQTLEHHPERRPTAKENGRVEVEVREFLFGRSPHVFRVIFAIDGDVVRILRIRRAQRRFLTHTELKQALERDRPEAE